MRYFIEVNAIIEKKILTCFYKNSDTSTMAETTGELKLLTGSVYNFKHTQIKLSKKMVIFNTLFCICIISEIFETKINSGTDESDRTTSQEFSQISPRKRFL